MAALVQGLRGLELGTSSTSSSTRDADGTATAPLCRTPQIKRNEVAWKWYESIGAPKLFVAPLVGYSEPAFRLLCRSYDADIASTPMIEAAGYVASERYRNEFAFTGGSEDRPLTTQLGGSEPAPLAAAAALVAPFCDAVELNMGCPQRCAKKNGSGAFLMEDLARATRCIAAMRRAVDAHNAASSGPRVATVVKIRCFDDVPRTVALARALEAAGAEMITVHGRTRHAGGGRRTAAQLANWAWIRAVRESVGIPCISNGNIRHADDVADCFAATGCDGVMSGVGALRPVWNSVDGVGRPKFDFHTGCGGRASSSRARAAGGTRSRRASVRTRWRRAPRRARPTPTCAASSRSRRPRRSGTAAI